MPIPSASPTATGEPEPVATLDMAATPSGPLDWNEAQSSAMLPAFHSDVSSLPKATRYTIEVQVYFQEGGSQARLEGLARILYSNTSGVALSDLVVMLWPNDDQYFAEMAAGPALVDGKVIIPEVLLDGVALRLRLENALPPGGQIDVSIPFSIDTFGPIGGRDPKRFGITEGVLAAPSFYPLVPPRAEGAWLADPAPPGGDTTTSEVAFYDVTISHPIGLSLVASGTARESRPGEAGWQSVQYVTGPMRDFAFVLGPLELSSREVEGVRLNAWVLPAHSDDARRMLDAAAIQMVLLNEIAGPYPYRELDLVDVPGAFGGIEYPGIVFIGTLGTHWVIDPTVHEVAHQWFYAIIGNDQLREPWLDEGAASFAQVLYYERASNPGRATALLNDFQNRLRASADPTLPIGLPVAGYTSSGGYATIVYAKGALFFEALRAELGDEAFSVFLQTYFQQYRYRLASAAAFQTVAEQACTCELSDLFSLWVHRGGVLPTP